MILEKMILNERGQVNFNKCDWDSKITTFFNKISWHFNVLTFSIKNSYTK
jgi:hypothetical protein